MEICFLFLDKFGVTIYVRSIIKLKKGKGPLHPIILFSHLSPSIYIHNLIFDSINHHHEGHFYNSQRLCLPFPFPFPFPFLIPLQYPLINCFPPVVTHH